jgi:hypothetical protein
LGLGVRYDPTVKNRNCDNWADWWVGDVGVTPKGWEMMIRYWMMGLRRRTVARKGLAGVRAVEYLPRWMDRGSEEGEDG